MTQENLAALCDTDTAYIGQIETARRFPSMEYIERISRALDVEPYELFKDKESKKGQAKLQENLRGELITIIEKIAKAFDIKEDEVFKE